MLSYRLVRDEKLLTVRSFCPHCKQIISWYDLIPVVSWIILSGKCRKCKAPISPLYPIIELLTAFSMSLLWFNVQPEYFPTYFFFFSALIITIRSDLELLLISRYVTLYLIPIAVLFSYYNLLPITPGESIAGALAGYGLLWLAARLFYKYTGKQGIGEGDLELLAMIGSFTGIFGMWISLCLGSLLGSLIGIIILIIHRRKSVLVLPFGPFLSFGAMLFIIYMPTILELIYNYSN